jgi:ATP-dependent Lon protease
MPNYPMLPLRDVVLFPGQTEELFVGRPRSIAAVQSAATGDRRLVLAAQRRAGQEEPEREDIHPHSVLARVEDLVRLPDGNVKARVTGLQRVHITGFTSTAPNFVVDVELLTEPDTQSVEAEALIRAVQKSFESYVTLGRRISSEDAVAVGVIDQAGQLADAVAPMLPLKLEAKQRLIATTDPVMRLEQLHDLLQREVEILTVERKIHNRVKKQIERGNKEPAEGGPPEAQERDEFRTELAELEEKVSAKPLTDEGKERCLKEVKKLKMMSPMSAEATVLRNYIDWVLALPWGLYTQDKIDIHEAEDILDEDHYGLKKVKERILEYLAVRALVKEIRGPILCFVGPPGVGKSSLARSIARAMARKFVRISLGGVRDEAEIRGHRRTYIGALPGKIMQGLKRAGTGNPVFLLDEVDKMSMDFRGDPSSALLEVLDPEQNHAFQDHYVDLDYDLSKVVFICTANNRSAIPLPLQDRMEIITLSSYTRYEKMRIGADFLVPKQVKEHGLTGEQVSFTRAGLRSLVDHYTREAGVRNLEREIGSVCRKIARNVLGGDGARAYKVNARTVQRLLGPLRHRVERAEPKPEVGLAHGLAVTHVGGDILKAEVTVFPGKGKLTITGKLGEVMQESAQAALSYVRSRARALGLTRDFYQGIDIHVHFPEGGIPKDGPSAGITMVTALVSALTGIPVRSDVAMTGEINLRGGVLPIGGLKEKALAAHRGGVSTVLFPAENQKDLRDIPSQVRRTLEMRPVSHMDEVLRAALALDEERELFRAVPTEDDYLGIRDVGDKKEDAPEDPAAPKRPAVH